MDVAINKGVHEWLESVKDELDGLKEQAEEKRIELEVLKVRKEVAELAVDSIEGSFLQEKFCNKYINEVDEEIKECSSELESLRGARKELSTFFKALEATIQSSSYR